MAASEGISSSLLSSIGTQAGQELKEAEAMQKLQECAMLSKTLDEKMTSLSFAMTSSGLAARKGSPTKAGTVP